MCTRSTLTVYMHMHKRRYMHMHMCMHMSCRAIKNCGVVFCERRHKLDKLDTLPVVGWPAERRLRWPRTSGLR